MSNDFSSCFRQDMISCMFVCAWASITCIIKYNARVFRSIRSVFIYNEQVCVNIFVYVYMYMYFLLHVAAPLCYSSTSLQLYTTPSVHFSELFSLESWKQTRDMWFSLLFYLHGFGSWNTLPLPTRPNTPTPTYLSLSKILAVSLAISLTFLYLPGAKLCILVFYFYYFLLSPSVQLE